METQGLLIIPVCSPARLLITPVCSPALCREETQSRLFPAGKPRAVPGGVLGPPTTPTWRWLEPQAGVSVGPPSHLLSTNRNCSSPTQAKMQQLRSGSHVPQEGPRSLGLGDAAAAVWTEGRDRPIPGLPPHMHETLSGAHHPNCQIKGAGSVEMGVMLPPLTLTLSPSLPTTFLPAA